MAKQQETLYDTIINTMISTVGNATVTENTKTTDVSKGFSSNNVRSLIITPDIIAVIYHIKGTMERNYKIKVLSPNVTKNAFNSELLELNPALYSLGKPFVCSNLEEIIVFTQSDKTVFNGFTLSDNDIDIRNLKSKRVRQESSIRELYGAYQSEDIETYVKKDIAAKVNNLIHGAWKELWTTKYRSSYEACKQFFIGVIKPALTNSLQRSKGTTQNAIKQEVYSEFAKILRQESSAAIANFAEDVIKEFKKALDEKSFDSRVMEEMKACYQSNSAVNNALSQCLIGYDRFVGIYVYDISYTLQDLNKLVATVSQNPKFLLHTKLKEQGITTEVSYEKHVNDYYNYRTKEQSSIYGEIDLQIAKYLDNLKEQMNVTTVDVEHKEVKETVTKAYLEKAKEVDNWLYFYDVLNKLITEYRINALAPELKVTMLPDFVIKSDMKIKPIKEENFKYLKKFESEDSSSVKIETLDYIKAYVYRNVLKYVLEAVTNLGIKHPILQKQIVKNSGAIKVSGMDNSLVQMNQKLGFKGEKVEDSICNLAVLICTYFLSHADKETKVMGINITAYMNKDLWSQILNR